MKISMHRYALIRIVVVFIVGFQSLCSWAELNLSVLDDWRTLEDEQFSVNYKNQDRELAEKTLALARDILPQLEGFLQWQVNTRIYISVVDSQDAPNGKAEVLPYNHILVYTTPPSVFHEMNNYNRWMRLLLTHELTHIVHIDMANGAPATLRKIFGRFPLLFPNRLEPDLFIEGLATYMETDWQHESGRGQSAYYSMMMRSEVDSGLLALGEVQQVRELWPTNQAYLYGVYFYQFMEDTYGKDSIPAFINEYSTHLLPFMLSTSSLRVTGKSISELWQEYQFWLEARFRPQIDQLKREGLTPAEQVSHVSYYNNRTVVLDDGAVAYVNWSPVQPASIVVMKADGTRRALSKVKWRARVVAEADGYLYFLQTSNCKDSYVYDELYRVSLTQWTEGDYTDVNRAEKITTCRRFTHAALSQDKKIWAMVKSLTGKQELVWVGRGKKKQHLLWRGDFDQQIAHPVWIDADNLIVNIKQPDKKWQLYTLNIHTLQPQLLPLALPAGNVQTPFYDAASATLFFTSDHTGVNDIYRSRVDGSHVQRLTRSLGGSADPVFADGKLYYSGYGAEGWSIFKLNMAETPALADEPLVKQAVTSDKGVQLSWNDSDVLQNPQQVLEKPYSPLPALWPTSWFFGSQSRGDTQEIGVQVSGHDPLSLHQYLLGVAYDINLHKASALMEYIFDTHLFFGYKHSHDISGNGEPLLDPAFRVDNYTTEDEWQIAATYPMPFDYIDITPFAALSQISQEFNDSVYATRYSYWDKHVNTSGLGFIYTYGEQYEQGISKSHGRWIKVSLENDDVDIRYGVRRGRGTRGGRGGSTWSNGVNTLDWREYIAVSERQVLALRGFWGQGSTGTDPFQLKDYKSLTTFTQSYVHERELVLRGYPGSLPELTDVNAELYSAEWRFPLWDVYRGIDGVPLGAHAIHGAVFYDNGAVWGTLPNPASHGRRHIYDSTGFELHTDLDLGYSLLPLQLSLGYAIPLQRTAAGKSPELYLTLGTAF